MTRFRREVIGDAHLILGDCREVLPTLGRVDAVVTDPPYGIGAERGIGKVTLEGSDFRACDSQWDSKPPSKDTFAAILAMSDEQIIWGGNFFDLPPSAAFFVWDKIQPEGLSLSMAEQAWVSFGASARIWRWKSMSINGGAAKHHPTQKPEELIKWCINRLPFDGGTILDPFMGSGTTGVACMKLGRKFIGIEIEERYFDIACKRVEEAWRQPRLFDEPRPKPRQEELSLLRGDV